jgi:glycosyltransferase involved in cell wall biosynthesis
MPHNKKLSILHYYVGDLHIANRMLRQAEAASAEYDVTLVYRAKWENSEHWANGRFRTIFAPKAKQSPSSATFWYIPDFLYQEWRLFLRLLRLNPDIFHPHQHSSLLITCLWLLFSQKPVVFDPHDMHIHDENRRGLQVRSKRWLEQFVIRWSRAVAVVSDGMRTFYQTNYPDKPIYLLPNLPTLNHDSPGNIPDGHKVFPLMDSAKDMIKLVYAGLIKPERLPLEVIKTIGGSKRPITLDIFGFSSTGYDAVISRYIQEERFHNVSLQGPYNESDVIERIRPYHYFVLPFQIVDENIRYCMPNKIYQALAAGLPIIASNMVEISKLVENHQIGYIYPDGDYTALATILAQLDITGSEYKEQHGRVCEAAAERLNYSAYQKELLKAYETALV